MNNNNENNAVVTFTTTTTARSVNTPSIASGRMPSAAGTTTIGGGLGGRIGGVGGVGGSFVIERDESGRSDLSMFSIQSVDMGEFLSEFRAAHHALFGGSSARPRICFQDLADIVDRIAVPLPDTNMIAALFLEMENASPQQSGLVNFEGFLSRMAHRIQGRFSSENLAGLFLQLAATANSMLAMNSNSMAVGGGQKQHAAASSNMSSPAVSRTGSPSFIHANNHNGAIDHNNNSVSSLILSSAVAVPRPPSSAASTDVALVAHTAWVPARFCVEEGLESLGIRREDIPQALLNQIGLLLSGNENNNNNNSSSTTTAAAATTTTATATTTNFSIQDFLRITNSLMMALQNQNNNFNAAPSTPYYNNNNNNHGNFGYYRGSMSNVASVQDLTYLNE